MSQENVEIVKRAMPTELRYAAVYTIRDGKIVRGREYLTMDEALRAAGLSE